MLRTRTSTTFRKRLGQPGAIASAGVYDALSARLAEMAGFEAVHHSGYGTAASILAKPDVGLLSFTEMCGQIKNISRAVNIPVVGDADTGYGNVLNVDRTIREYIWAGAAGTFLEDQEWPKRCGHMEGKTVVSREEMAGKLRSAVAARNEEDSDFVIIYRTDALAVNGLDDALDRAKTALDAGVDMIFVEALESIEQMERVGREIDAPLMLNLIEGGKTPFVSVGEAEEMGFNYIVYALSSLYAAAKGMYDVLRDIREGGAPEGRLKKMASFQDFAEIVGIDEIRSTEERFLQKDVLERKYHGIDHIVKH